MTMRVALDPSNKPRQWCRAGGVFQRADLGTILVLRVIFGILSIRDRVHLLQNVPAATLTRDPATYRA